MNNTCLLNSFVVFHPIVFPHQLLLPHTLWLVVVVLFEEGWITNDNIKCHHDSLMQVVYRGAVEMKRERRFN